MKISLVLATLLAMVLLNVPAAFGQNKNRRVFERRNNGGGSGGSGGAQSRSRVKVASGNRGPSKAQAESFAKRQPPKSATAKRVFQSPFFSAECDSLPKCCQTTTEIYEYVQDTNGDECFVHFPYGGIEETLCSYSSYNRRCCKKQNYAWRVGKCTDCCSKTVSVIAVCERYGRYRYIFLDYEVYNDCCCE